MIKKKHGHKNVIPVFYQLLYHIKIQWKLEKLDTLVHYKHLCHLYTICTGSLFCLLYSEYDVKIGQDFLDIFYYSIVAPATSWKIKPCAIQTSVKKETLGSNNYGSRVVDPGCDYPDPVRTASKTGSDTKNPGLDPALKIKPDPS